GSDLDRVHVRLNWLNPADPAAEFDQLYRQAIAVVFSEWAGIVRAARVLQRRVEMDGEEFEEAWRRVRSTEAQRARALRDLEREGCVMPDAPDVLARVA